MSTALAWYGSWVSTVVSFCHWLPGPIAYFMTVPLVVFIGILLPLWLVGCVVLSPWILRYRTIPWYSKLYWDRKESRLTTRYARTRTG